MGTHHSCNQSSKGGLGKPPGCCPTGLFGWVRPWLHQISISDAFFELAVTFSKVWIFGGLVYNSEMPRGGFTWHPSLTVCIVQWCRWLAAALGGCR